MPCFKGIAVSVHANGAPLPEYGPQKQSRFSRISTYIPVPQPQLDPDSLKPVPSKFAISITLLTPGLPIPYSTPKVTDEVPSPKPQYVAGAAPATPDRVGSTSTINPYIPMTNSDNETIAAYIYFDGRTKEEVATLLRPGEETWVNSRWVQVPQSEGGGLAEREFLFREVGLERWLNGLDLHGHDAAEKLEKRRRKFERRRQQKAGVETRPRDGMDTGDNAQRDGFDEVSYQASTDDDEPPEATGQIKVLMFRVLASGEIKKGEYSPQFDAHDDDEDDHTTSKLASASSIDAEVEHTTSFAKPKSLDPKTISTQTVTGIDGPEKPYASFTFFYRGERQLHKIGVLSSGKGLDATPRSVKRRSGQLDLSNLGPLKSTGTVGFSTFRDRNVDAMRRRKARKKSIGHVDGSLHDDSEDDDDDDFTIAQNSAEADEKDVYRHNEAVDVTSQGELAEGVNRIHLKRGHSAEKEDLDNTVSKNPMLDSHATEGSTSNPEPQPQTAHNSSNSSGSPLKRQRPELATTTSTHDVLQDSSIE